MTDVPNNAETPRQKLAQAARKTDIQATNDGARAATQAAILINGGAATAIHAFLSTYLSKSPSPPPSILYGASAALFGYAVGVCLGAWSMWCSSQASAKFGLRWETFLDYDMDPKKRKLAEDTYLNEGDRWLRRHRNSFTTSILLFFISSLVMAFGYFVSAK
jgi:hypothetical protein